MIYEKLIPVKKQVKAVCELLGFDPLYLANEGKLIFLVDEKDEIKLLNELKNFNKTKSSGTIGEVLKTKESIVIKENIYGIKKIVDILTGEQIPRIC